MLIRMDKLLSSELGLSRTDAKKLLSQGRVLVDGVAVKSGSDKADTDKSEILVDGKRIAYREFLYLIMNKPLGVVSSTDGHDGETVIDLVPKELFRKGLFPAGRLDKYSEGMLIITDDGAFAHKILAPKSHLPKTYEVTLDAPIINDALVEEFSKGVYLGGGERSSPAKLVPISSSSGRVTIYEGIYHQVRRMFDQNGAHVISLKRIQIGGLPLDEKLAPGQVREMTADELSQLMKTDERS